MAVKNVVAKSWALTASFDGLLYSNWPAGDKPTGYQTTPTLLALDTDSGSLTGGENNKGFYIEAYGYNLGRKDKLGTSAGCRAFFRDPLGDNAWHEVDNYRAITLLNNFSTHQMMSVIFQIGSLGGSQTNGRTLDVKLTVNSVDTNVLVGYFTIQPGRTWFVDNVAGSDATMKPDDITKPGRYLQNYSGGSTAVTGSLWAATTAQGDTGVQPGDCIVIRANSGTPWSDQNGFDGRWCRFREARHLGTAPNGSVGHGRIRFTRYPGPINGNAPEVPFFQDPSSGLGGIHGPNSAYANAALGTATGQYVAISGLKVFSAVSSGSSDGAPINLQQGADFWWVSNCELSWPTTTTALAGALPGQGYNCVLQCNYIHDVNCDQSSMTNHGIYIGSGAQSFTASAVATAEYLAAAKSGPCSHNWTVRWNRIEDIQGGSGIQWNDTQGLGDHFIGHKVYGNFVLRAAKNGITGASSLQSADIYNNVIVDCCGGPQNGGSFKISDNVASRAVNFTHNTLIQTATTGAYNQMIVNDGANQTSGTLNIKGNIIVMRSGHNASLGFTTYGASDTGVVMANNLYYDFGGVVTTAPTKDTAATYGNPLFTDLTNLNLTLATSSPGLGAMTVAEPVAIATDFYGIARPQTGTGSPSGSKNDYGATQGIGT